MNYITTMLPHFLSFKSATSLSGDDVKLSERLTIPSRRLRGFEYGKVDLKMEMTLLEEIMFHQ